MNKMMKYLLIGIPFILLFIFFSSQISSTPWIWYLTRVFGLVSFFFLFITIILGEMRLLAMVKSNFPLFKYHVPVSIFTLVLVVLHFISAAFDKYKWGVGLSFSQYLGFSFSDKWLVLLSLGSLAMYLIIIVGLSSMKPMMRALRFKRWKLIHYFSYLSFILAFVHAINLGTDIKTSAVSVLVKPFTIICFWIVIAFLAVRILNSFKLFEDQVEINLTAAFFIILLIGGIFVTSFIASAATQVTQDVNNEVTAEISYLENANDLLQTQISLIEEELNVAGGTS